MPRPVFYIADVKASPAVERKIREKHNVSPAEVKEACVLTPVTQAGWNHKPGLGSRLYVVGRTYQKRRLKIVLYPIDVRDGLWSLCTARPTTRAPH
jgi:hypothetical protein